VTAKLDTRAFEAALRRLAPFVVDDKRKQIQQRLLTAERRAETLSTLARWVSARTAPLEGIDKSPAGLEARLGKLEGVCIAASGAIRCTVIDALVAGRACDSVFVADNGMVALITQGDGGAIVCSRI
jgi:hypothetical protein